MQCPKCRSRQITKKGYFRKKLTRKYCQRYWCLDCKHKFSTASFSKDKFQKKPFINKPLMLNLCSGVSLRRSALNLGVSYSTIYRRFLWLIEQAKSAHFEHLKTYQSHERTVLYLDEMESIEHTKLKPLTLPLVVDQDQNILGIEVGEIPAKGRLAYISRKKYGPRLDQSSEKIQALLQALPDGIAPNQIKSDGKLSYVNLIKKRFPKIAHEVHIRKSDKSIEQLYLAKEKGFDPMFALNQRCAKLRSDIKRLVRRSWCTTKKPENLRGHLLLYCCYNNKLAVL